MSKISKKTLDKYKVQILALQEAQDFLHEKCVKEIGVSSEDKDSEVFDLVFDYLFNDFCSKYLEEYLGE
jgi:hypothetical protein